MKTTLILLENHLGKKQINAADKQNIVKDDWFKIFRINRLYEKDKIAQNKREVWGAQWGLLNISEIDIKKGN